MAISSRTLSDTRGFAKVLVEFTNDSATTTVIDASGLNAHQNNGQLKIRGLKFGLTGYATLSFIKNGATSEKAITLAGSERYDSGTIVNSAGAANHATDGDISITTVSASGYVVIEVVKDNFNYS
tara:strand:+ start:175 stop:549 length:375 start_codon:yes stop_codon:yes gene_type:complete